MQESIIIGKYYHTDSFLHRLDPRVKLVWLIVTFISFFSVDNLYFYPLYFIFFGIMIAVSRLPLKLFLAPLKRFAFIIAFTAALNLFFTPGDVLCKLWVFSITDAGCYQAALVAVRLCLVIIISQIFLVTTKPEQICKGLSQGLAFLKVFKVNVGELALIMTLTLRFIPILSEEAAIIKKARIARGGSLTGGVFAKAKSLLPMLVVLFVSAVNKSSALAAAMEARGFDPSGNVTATALDSLKYKKSDFAAYILLAVCSILTIILAKKLVFR